MPLPSHPIYNERKTPAVIRSRRVSNFSFNSRRDTPLKVYFPHLGQLQKFDETMTLPVNRNPSLINLISIPEVVVRSRLLLVW